MPGPCRKLGVTGKARSGSIHSVAANRSLHPSGADGMFTYMKSTLFGGLVLLTAVAFPVLANEADMNIACTSILVNDATASDVAETTFEIRFTSDFSDTAVNSLNGEWYQVIGTVGYQSVFTLESPDFDIAETGVLDVEIPSPGDANLNFLTDFFEVDQAVSGSTGGTVHIGNKSQPVTAVWDRAAGQATGTVTISFPGFPSLLIGDLSFTHTFEIFQYKGKLVYTPPAADGAIPARVQLARVGGEGTFNGTFPLRLAADGTIERLAATWTNAVDETFELLGSKEISDVDLSLVRVPLRKQYAGSFFFVDGIPSTPDFQDEFDLWDVFISDPNDADGDGIADLGDAPAAAPPQAGIVWINNTLRLGLQGRAGTRVNIQRRASLTSGDWVTTQSFVLASDNETFALPTPEAGASFWRVTGP